MERLTGLDEANRQLEVAQALYEARGVPAIPWDRLTLAQKRPWVDRACEPHALLRLPTL